MGLSGASSDVSPSCSLACVAVNMPQQTTVGKSGPSPWCCIPPPPRTRTTVNITTLLLLNKWMISLFCTTLLPCGTDPPLSQAVVRQYCRALWRQEFHAGRIPLAAKTRLAALFDFFAKYPGLRSQVGARICSFAQGMPAADVVGAKINAYCVLECSVDSGAGVAAVLNAACRASVMEKIRPLYCKDGTPSWKTKGLGSRYMHRAVGVGIVAIICLAVWIGMLCTFANILGNTGDFLHDTTSNGTATGRSRSPEPFSEAEPYIIGLGLTALPCLCSLAMLFCFPHVYSQARCSPGAEDDGSGKRFAVLFCAVPALVCAVVWLIMLIAFAVLLSGVNVERQFVVGSVGLCVTAVPAAAAAFSISSFLNSCCQFGNAGGCYEIRCSCCYCPKSLCCYMCEAESKEEWESRVWRTHFRLREDAHTYRVCCRPYPCFCICGKTCCE